MARLREIVAGASLLAAAVLCAATVGHAATVANTTMLGHTATTGHATTVARAATAKQASELWATVNLCNTPHHPDTIGIRGSMPGDGHTHDQMYMRFLVQNLDATTHKWANVGRSADSGFVLVGSAALTRQAGRSFEFKPTASTYTLRGLVEFQWHHAGHTVRIVNLPTTADRTSLAGAEPTGFSAATCALP